ncbi:hypothetical protein H0H87_010210 [Tephrocybe sp. NHM501043]|nr:hypothetical protein H0H87_010210 [Tephrocybe sp. NHM501043]
MDILWAISHPPKSGVGSNAYGAAPTTGSFAVPTPPYADGSVSMYEDFVGGVQFWGYGLVSGSGDGAVRMWDSTYISFCLANVLIRLTGDPVRTGQAHRTLLGHTAPVSCLQFDEIHIASGSLDKTIRVSSELLSFFSFLFDEASDMGSPDWGHL